MSTLLQLLKNKKIKKLKKKSSVKLKKNPQKKAICLRVLTTSPKKPNSANRRIVKLSILNYKIKSTAKIPGEGHSLQQHSTVLIEGAKVRDLIGVNYAAIRGKLDLAGVANRKTSRSRFGVKKSI